LGGVMAAGNAVVDTVVEKKLRDSQTVRDIHADVSGLKDKTDTLKARMDTLANEQRKLANEQRKHQNVLREFLGSMMEVNPALKEEIRKRGNSNLEVARKKAENESLLDKLVEDKQ
jgi:FtsZ-binding cell division protein ZapB